MSTEIKCAKCGKVIGHLQPFFRNPDGSVLCYDCKRGKEDIGEENARTGN